MSVESGHVGPADAPAKARGRPRSEPARQAILAAATDLLLARGLSAVSMDSIAERAGVSKATIYRWWPTKETLALDVLYEQLTEPSPEPPDTGTLRGDLLELFTGWIERVGERPFGRMIGALVTEAATDPTFGALYRERYVEPRRAQAREIFAAAIARGEVGIGTDVEAAIDLLYGPLYHRLLHGHAPLSREFVGYIVGVVVDGLGALRGVQAVQLGADLVGIGVLSVLENGKCLLPGIPSLGQIASGVTSIAEMGKDFRFVVAVA
jgi:AcrR family transcriptional regulator